MKPIITKSLVLPMLYGVLASWLIGGAVGVALLLHYTHLDITTMLIAVSALLLLAVMPALMRGAWVYSNLRRFHTAEYFYDLGNGTEMSKALAAYERKVNRAVTAWINRMILRPAFNVVVVAYLLVVLQSGQWLVSLWVFAAMLIVVLSVEIGVWTMLFAARKLSYDKYGNLKNN